MPAGPSGRALSGRGPGLGCPARWAGGRVPDGAGPRLSIRSAGEASVLRTRRWESGRPHLFLSHCSLAGKEMTGRGQPSGCSHTCPAVCLPAGPGPLTAPCLWPCSVLAPVPLPLRLLPTVCAPSHLPGRPNTEGLSNASVVDKLGGQDRECSGHGGQWSSHWLTAATLPLGPPRVPPSHPLVRGGWREPKPPCACPCTAAVSLANIPQSTLWGQGPIPAARGLLRADAALPSATALQAGAPWFGRKVTWQALLSLCS